MKQFLLCFALFALLANASCEISQKEVIDFLVNYGNDLIGSTEKFMHEQRRLGHENLLGKLEKNLVEAELQVIALRSASATAHLDDEKSLHELHELQHKVLGLLTAIEEEILHVKKATGNVPVTVAPGEHPTPKPWPNPDRVLTLKDAKDVQAAAHTLLQTYHGPNRTKIEQLVNMIFYDVKTIESGEYEDIQLQWVLIQLTNHIKSLRIYLNETHPTTPSKPAVTLAPPTTADAAHTTIKVGKEVMATAHTLLQTYHGPNRAKILELVNKIFYNVNALEIGKSSGQTLQYLIAGTNMDIRSLRIYLDKSH